MDPVQLVFLILNVINILTSEVLIVSNSNDPAIPYRLPYYSDGKNSCYAFEHEAESLTIQSERDNCDISKMMEKFKASGGLVLPENAVDQVPIFRDVSEISDYSELMRTMAEIHSYFETLPAEERAAYGNDPAVFADSLVAEPMPQPPASSESGSNGEVPVDPVPPSSGSESGPSDSPPKVGPDSP